MVLIVIISLFAQSKIDDNKISYNNCYTKFYKYVLVTLFIYVSVPIEIIN